MTGFLSFLSPVASGLAPGSNAKVIKRKKEKGHGKTEAENEQRTMECISKGDRSGLSCSRVSESFHHKNSMGFDSMSLFSGIGGM